MRLLIFVSKKRLLNWQILFDTSCFFMSRCADCITIQSLSQALGTFFYLPPPLDSLLSVYMPSRSTWIMCLYWCSFAFFSIKWHCASLESRISSVFRAAWTIHLSWVVFIVNYVYASVLCYIFIMLLRLDLIFLQTYVCVHSATGLTQ